MMLGWMGETVSLGSEKSIIDVGICFVNSLILSKYAIKNPNLFFKLQI
jgi:hypothetical protein